MFWFWILKCHHYQKNFLISCETLAVNSDIYLLVSNQQVKKYLLLYKVIYLKTTYAIFKGSAEVYIYTKRSTIVLNNK